VRTTPTCPACGIEIAPDARECARCHLSVELFPAVLEAAGSGGTTDPTYLRTIGELLATVAIDQPAPTVPEPAQNLLTPPERVVGLPEDAGIPPLPARGAEPIRPVIDLPAVPPETDELPDVQRRLDEYFRVGRRLGLDFTDFRDRANSAALVRDVDSLEILAREMFVHLSSAVAEEYEALLARRNELAQLLPTSAADVEITSVRRAIGVGDLAGAQRRLTTVRDELGKLEHQWEVARILVAEGELMVATIRELGGDPTPATGPLEQGRKLFADGRRADAERVLARGAVALWTVLEPRLMNDLKRLRDRLVDARSAGLDIRPATREFRTMSEELRKRNFVGTILAYRRLKAAVEHAAPSGVEAEGAPDLSGPVRYSPSA
jgi:hypothetical protein